MKKLLLALLSLALFLPALAATSVSAQDSDPIRVAVVYSGNLGDQSYNDSANIGATQAIEDFGIEVRNMEGTTPDVWESNLLSAADQGYDLVICSSSNFEEYLINNKGATYHDFNLTFEKMSLDGALFDIEKLKYFSKEYLGKLNKDQFFDLAYAYAKRYDNTLLNLIEISLRKIP